MAGLPQLITKSYKSIKHITYILSNSPGEETYNRTDDN